MAHLKHALKELGKGSNSIPLSNAQDSGVNVSGPGLNRSVGVGDSTSSVIVEVSLDVTSDHLLESGDLFIDLTWRSAANGVGNSNAVGAETVHERVELQNLTEVGAKRVLAGESDLDAVGLGEFDDLLGLGGDPVEILSVGMLHELSGSTNAHVAVVKVLVECENYMRV